MAEDVAGGEQLIVTARSLARVGNLEAAAPAEGKPGEDPLERALTINRYRRIAELLEAESKAVDPDVFLTLQDRETSLFQSRLTERAEAAGAEVERAPLLSGGEEVKFGPGLEDPWGWATSLFDWIDRGHAHQLVRPDDDEPEPLANPARIAMLSDWGTGLYGAPVSVQTLKETGPWDLLLHLGDVYYSGTPKEVAKRFTALWPKSSATLNRALNANHEMYSGGYGYFDGILADFGQSASYFALANDNWLLIGLDTAYVDHDMDATQVAWVNRVVKEGRKRKDGSEPKDGGERKVVLFSHQQLFSRLDKQGPRLHEALKPLLEEGAITAWYWGHEHDCVVYEAHPKYGLLARCLGNGGVPAPRRGVVKNAETARSLAGVTWKRLGATDDSPGCLALDGPNPYIKGKEQKFLPHGYMTLELEGKRLTERMHLPDGTEIWRHEIA